MWTHDRPRTPRRLAARRAAAAGAVVATLSCCAAPRPAAVDPPLAPPAPASSAAVPSGQPQPAPSRTAAAGDEDGDDAALDVARRWLVAYRSRDYTDPGPDAWIDRVRGLVTDAQARRNAALRGRSGGAEWRRTLAGHCHTTVHEVTAVVPPEAPGTATLVNAQLSGVLVTSCPVADTATTRVPVAATVLLRREQGHWRVDRKLY